MEFLECVPEECWKSLTSLESLSISVCPGLTSLSKAPPPAYSLDSKELDLSKYDESSGGKNILELRSLRSVCIESLPKLASLPQWLLQLSNLEDLSVRFCSELDLCNNNNNLILDFHGGLQNLRSVELDELPKLASLPQWLLQASSLEDLSIRFCSNLKALPEQIEALQSLRELRIWSCPLLTSLPEGMRRLASLTHLRIECCPELERRCKRDGGEDWDNLIEVRIFSCRRCKSLPPLGQLPHLKTLEIRQLTELEYIELGHSSTSIASFPSLLKLDIGGCGKLKAVPPTPHLEDLRLTRAHPALINMIVGLNKLKRLEIEEIESLEYVPEKCWKSLASLESLRIVDCPGLTSLSKAAAPPPPLGRRHQSNQVDLDSSDSKELHLSNYHESSGGNNNLVLDSHGGFHHSLRSVGISGLPKLASLPQWLLQASNLVHLFIAGCDELDICKDESGNLLILDSHGGFHHSLRYLKIHDLPKLASLPQWLLRASNLERLLIFTCSNLKALPEQIEAFQSLQCLEIGICPSLTSLPEGMRRLASLTRLRIYNCPKLERRCKRDGGEDWDKIAHIPDIEL